MPSSSTRILIQKLDEQLALTAERWMEMVREIEILKRQSESVGQPTIDLAEIKIRLNSEYEIRVNQIIEDARDLLQVETAKFRAETKHLRDQILEKEKKINELILTNKYMTQENVQQTKIVQETLTARKNDQEKSQSDNQQLIQEFKNAAVLHSREVEQLKKSIREQQDLTKAKQEEIVSLTDASEMLNTRFNTLNKNMSAEVEKLNAELDEQADEYSRVTGEQQTVIDDLKRKNQGLEMRLREKKPETPVLSKTEADEHISNDETLLGLNSTIIQLKTQLAHHREAINIMEESHSRLMILSSALGGINNYDRTVIVDNIKRNVGRAIELSMVESIPHDKWDYVCNKLDSERLAEAKACESLGPQDCLKYCRTCQWSGDMCQKLNPNLE